MANLYNVLIRPLVTEKSSYQSGKLSQYVFIVAARVNTVAQVSQTVHATPTPAPAPTQRRECAIKPKW